MKHYLHNKAVTLDGSGVVTGGVSVGYVKILTRLGLDAETAYADVVSNFPTIWTNDHRGDGLATIRMSAATTGQKEYMSVYPNQMPQPSSVIDGALLFDPRNESTAFSRNIALMRFWHLTHPVGGKLAHGDMYWPEWAEAVLAVRGRFVDPEPTTILLTRRSGAIPMSAMIPNGRRRSTTRSSSRTTISSGCRRSR